MLKYVLLEVCRCHFCKKSWYFVCVNDAWGNEVRVIRRQENDDVVIGEDDGIRFYVLVNDGAGFYSAYCACVFKKK